MGCNLERWTLAVLATCLWPSSEICFSRSRTEDRVLFEAVGPVMSVTIEAFFSLKSKHSNAHTTTVQRTCQHRNCSYASMLTQRETIHVRALPTKRLVEGTSNRLTRSVADLTGSVSIAAAALRRGASLRNDQSSPSQ